MNKALLLAGVGIVLAACGYVDEYEKGVYDYEPTYCYKTIGGVSCYREPDHRDERRLVNYYGPHPTRYDAPPEPPKPILKAPPKVDHYVRDPDVIPDPVTQQPVVHGQSVSLNTVSAGQTAPVLKPEPVQALPFTFIPEPVAPPAPQAAPTATAEQVGPTSAIQAGE